MAFFGRTGESFFTYISSFVTLEPCGQELTAFIGYTGTCFRKAYFYCEIPHVLA